MKVVVIGAGYAGTMAANRLARRGRGVQITVVNPRAEFVERIRLHQLIAGSGAATRPLRDVLDDSIMCRVASAAKVGDGTVLLDDGDELEYDRLVYAAGGAVVAPEGTFAVGGFDDAGRAATRLAALPSAARVVVVGGGLTGVETAAEVASRRPDLRVRLVSDAPVAGSLGTSARARVAEVLTGLNVDVMRGEWSAADHSDLTLWAVARQVSEVARQSGWTVDADGRVVVDRYLRASTTRGCSLSATARRSPVRG